MLSSRGLALLCLAAVGIRAQDDTTSSTATATSSESVATFRELSFTNSYRTLTGSDIPAGVTAFTGSEYTYVRVTGQRTATSSSSAVQTGSANATGSSDPQITASTRSVELTQIGGARPTNGTNSTISSTTSSAQPTNTVPCNGFPEFCNRRYSNITYIAAHNAAFVVANNAASNQEIPILGQLNDGIRMLQGQVHYVNETLYNCHTSCDQLNAGTWQSELETVRAWLQEHPYDVLTILIGNSDVRDVEDFVPAITNAGLLPYVYEPQYIPQYREQWPTLGEMILGNHRLVIFMDYEADQSRVPYILDEFTHMFETPFSPTDQSFPCTIDRPPELDETEARENWMYLANHNLNTVVDLSSLGFTTAEAILIPNTAELNLTNGEANQFGRLGAMSLNCTADWDRAPNFLLVDYYNRGSNMNGVPMEGSVFHVAASANGVQYTQECCGMDLTSAAAARRMSSIALVGALVATMVLTW